MEKNQEFTVTIEDMNEDGAGVGKLDGYIWFIKDTVIGDVVRAKAMKMKKSYGFARLMEVLEPSAGRVEPPCPVSRQCGGCQLQAMSYEEQLRFKENKVLNNLMRIGKFKRDEIKMLPIMGMENPWRYRNKAQFPFGRNKDGEIIAGFYAGRTHDIIGNDDCLLGVEENQEILGIIKGFMKENGLEPYDENAHKGLVRHVLIRKGFKTGELMVCLVINGRTLEDGLRDNRADCLSNRQVDGLLDSRADSLADNSADRLAGCLVEKLCQVKGMTSISYSVNMEKTNVIMGKEVVNLYGPGYITDYIGDVQYQISPLSFYQVNPVQTEKLYGTALDYADVSGNETVWDLYCGIGTISLFLAQKAKKVYGVEIVPQAIEDARRNAALNGMDNVEFFVGKAEEVLPEQYKKNQIHADVIVVDPPRKGCDTVCLDTILKMRPEKVVYVSCDSATLARDLRYLADGGYVVGKVRGCDMFPGTVHVETVALLTRKPQ
ncbi:23S rRNA (uracil(1939)-C(5))-methyltransferase RlmD [Lachnoclostridium pacaense]|uniref:23S rRNA (uracil(1939)-C(5))-methyltransferase RlmD n=1 Tax=Enterocloster hominis (ex Hitch et al. 2024) TaxID=1917870 RepID=UPI001D127118|nr:23S rRNA (uracil(1939)-C(5))-methyltransferase RlmD [Lachnoclostridium pacaense]MCC2817402.1 23S rRNA (uracil(1939)-C(5))-methyltransferase RlmD [Lachnoclostridium pacaense]